MWKYIVEPGRPQMIIWRMRIACWVPKTKNIIMISNNDSFSTATVVATKAPPCSVYTYIACLV